jgi:hypothetical protein
MFTGELDLAVSLAVQRIVEFRQRGVINDGKLECGPEIWK